MRTVLRLCEFYPGICLTTGEKARKNLSSGRKNLSWGKKNQSTVYILPKHPHITKPPHTHTLPHITKPTHTHPHPHQGFCVPNGGEGHTNMLENGNPNFYGD
jgi:hypothetical protein